MHSVFALAGLGVKNCDCAFQTTKKFDNTSTSNYTVRRLLLNEVQKFLFKIFEKTQKY